MNSIYLTEYKLPDFRDNYRNSYVSDAKSDNCVLIPYLPQSEDCTNMDKVEMKSKSSAEKDSITDVASQFMNENTPDFVFNMIPDNYLKFAANTTMLNKADEAELLRDLPRKADGSYDTEKIKKTLQTAINTIKAENANLEERLNFGTYKNLINGVDIWAFLMGPEISGMLENADILKAQRMFSLQDLNLTKYLQKTFEEDSEAYKMLEKINFKSSFEIKENISKQNQALDELLNIDLSSEEGIKTLLSKYKEVTHTGFSFQNIENYEKVKNNNTLNKEKKMEEYMKAFGSVDNAVDTTNCEIFTMVAYEVLFKYLIPKIINKCVPYGKFFAPFIPAGVELAETLTSGTKNGHAINTDAITVENASRVAIDGFVHYIMVSDFNFGFLSDIYKKIPGSDKVPKGFLRWNYKSAFKGMRSGAKALVGLLTSNSLDPVFAQKMFDKGANKWERAGSTVFNVMTGYVFIPSAIYHRNDSKKDSEIFDT